MLLAISRAVGCGSFFGGGVPRARRSPKIRQPYLWHFTVDDVDRPSTVVESCPFRLQKNGRLGRSWTPRPFSKNADHTVSLDGLDDLDGLISSMGKENTIEEHSYDPQHIFGPRSNLDRVRWWIVIEGARHIRMGRNQPDRLPHAYCDAQVHVSLPGITGIERELAKKLGGAWS
jgi:hypothetical protein